ncbi:hypothetical protein M8J75_000098 [Diaphorina citri]|nr:hypothetical protein M8J75_000098 [Diaphorina citri]
MPSISILWKEYCLKSTVHGLRYVVEPKRPFVERLIWVGLVSTAAVCIFLQHWGSWVAFSTGQTEIVVDNPHYPLGKIDFPAVTVCPVNKVMLKLGPNISQELEDQFLNTILVVSLTRYPFYNQPLEFMKKLNVGPSIEEMFERCFWRGVLFNCSDLVRLQRTEEGFCYSFNSKTSERTSISDINPPFENEHGHLESIRNNAAGKITGFEFYLKSLEHEYLPNDKRIRAYSVIVHSPEDFPDVTSSFIQWKEAGKVSRILVSLSTVIGDDSLRRVSKEKRGCYFVDEFYRAPNTELPSYVGNDEDNCYQRCRLRAIYDLCNCTPYYFQSFRDDGKHCGIEEMECLSSVNVLQRNTPPPEGQPGFPQWSLPVYMNCSCPQPCTFVTYTTETQHTFADVFTATDYYIYVDIIYKELFAISYTRYLRYTFKDLLVSFGGVASLFLGCSLVSIAEIFYFTLRTVVIKLYHSSAEDDSMINIQESNPLSVVDAVRAGWLRCFDPDEYEREKHKRWMAQFKESLAQLSAQRRCSVRPADSLEKSSSKLTFK